MQFRIREAQKEDMPAVREMIQELADFEKMPDGPKITVEDLIRDGGFNDATKPPQFFCNIAEGSDEDPAASQTMNPIGYTLCYFSYSMWKGKTIFLEDIYVRPNYRNRCVGQQLFIAVMSLCRRLSCKALSFHVLDWNPAKEFYAKFNAINLTERSGQNVFRLDEHAIDELLRPRGEGAAPSE